MRQNSPDPRSVLRGLAGTDLRLLHGAGAHALRCPGKEDLMHPVLSGTAGILLLGCAAAVALAVFPLRGGKGQHAHAGPGTVTVEHLCGARAEAESEDQEEIEWPRVDWDELSAREMIEFPAGRDDLPAAEAFPDPADVFPGLADAFPGVPDAFPEPAFLDVAAALPESADAFPDVTDAFPDLASAFRGAADPVDHEYVGRHRLRCNDMLSHRLEWELINWPEPVRGPYKVDIAFVPPGVEILAPASH
nr:hypothetical protein [Saccharopolyspora erythraea]